MSPTVTVSDRHDAVYARSRRWRWSASAVAGMPRPLPTTGGSTTAWSPTSTPMQHQAGCTTEIKINPKLRLAAQWHTDDVLNNRALDGDIGSDGSTVADRARNAGYAGPVAETVAINPALAISGIEMINQWYYRPDYNAIMSDCSNVDIGVWSENLLDRTVVVAVYGKGDGAPPVPSSSATSARFPAGRPNRFIRHPA